MQERGLLRLLRGGWRRVLGGRGVLGGRDVLGGGHRDLELRAGVGAGRDDDHELLARRGHHHHLLSRVHVLGHGHQHQRHARRLLGHVGLLLRGGGGLWLRGRRSLGHGGRLRVGHIDGVHDSSQVCHEALGELRLRAASDGEAVAPQHALDVVDRCLDGKTTFPQDVQLALEGANNEVIFVASDRQVRVPAQDFLEVGASQTAQVVLERRSLLREHRRHTCAEQRGRGRCVIHKEHSVWCMVRARAPRAAPRRATAHCATPRCAPPSGLSEASGECGEKVFPSRVGNTTRDRGAKRRNHLRFDSI